MAQSTSGSLRIGRVLGIDVYVHWTWALLGYFQIMHRSNVGPFAYGNLGWNAVEFLSVFGIVLLHEFGHALACRSVGGRADRVVLWLLGGAAFVNPPPRPGALLWSIAAGPLVNLILFPILLGLAFLPRARGRQGRIDAPPGGGRLSQHGVFVLNILPIYPLDGGQILHALLWFVIGRVKSLVVVSAIGLVCGVVVVIDALFTRDLWLLLIAAFVALQCLGGFQQARPCCPAC